MLYLLQIYVLVAIAILLPFFAGYLALTVLRLGYFAAIGIVHTVRVSLPRAAFGKRGSAIVEVTNTRRRFEPAIGEKLVTPVDTDRRSARRVA